MMIVKSGGGVRRFAFVRKEVKIEDGTTQVILTPNKRAACKPHKRFKNLSRIMECGRETGYLDDLRIVHRMDRRHIAVELKELVKSGGYQADIVKAGDLIPFRAECMPKAKAKSVTVGFSAEPSYVY